MSASSTKIRAAARSRWRDMLRLLDLPTGHSAWTVTLIALNLLFAGWLLQERVFAADAADMIVPHLHRLTRWLLGGMPLMLFLGFVLWSARRSSGRRR